jgi:hypothetical protein
MLKTIYGVLRAALLIAAFLPFLAGNASSQSRGLPGDAAAAAPSSCAAEQVAIPPELMSLVLAAYPQDGAKRLKSAPVPGSDLMAQSYRCGNAYCSQGTICCYNNNNGRNYCCVRGSRCGGNGYCS